MYTLVVCDDHPLFRNGIVNIIEGFAKFQILSDVSSGAELIHLLEDGVTPDIILLDISMPNGMNGYEVSNYISLRFPVIKIIGFSAYDNEQAELGMIMSGAKGFLPKTLNYDTFISAITWIAEGNCCCIRDGKITYLPVIFEADSVNHWVNTLMQREIEAAGLMCSGMPYKQIAGRLNISVNTLENIRIRIFEKLNCSSRTEVAYFMLTTGLLVGRFPEVG